MAPKAKEKKNEGGEKKGWFSAFKGKKVVKAKLGEESTMYYNEKLKRWVEKGKEDEVANEPGAAPPPIVTSTQLPTGPTQRRAIKQRYVLQNNLSVSSSFSGSLSEAGAPGGMSAPPSMTGIAPMISPAASGVLPPRFFMPPAASPAPTDENGGEGESSYGGAEASGVSSSGGAATPSFFVPPANGGGHGSISEAGFTAGDTDSTSTSTAANFFVPAANTTQGGESDSAMDLTVAEESTAADEVIHILSEFYAMDPAKSCEAPPPPTGSFFVPPASMSTDQSSSTGNNLFRQSAKSKTGASSNLYATTASSKKTPAKSGGNFFTPTEAASSSTQPQFSFIPSSKPVSAFQSWQDDNQQLPFIEGAAAASPEEGSPAQASAAPMEVNGDSDQAQGGADNGWDGEGGYAMQQEGAPGHTQYASACEVQDGGVSAYMPYTANGGAAADGMAQASGCNGGAAADGMTYAYGAYGGAAADGTTYAYGSNSGATADGMAHEYGADGGEDAEGMAGGYGANGGAAADGTTYAYGANGGAAAGGTSYAYGANGGAAADGTTYAHVANGGEDAEGMAGGYRASSGGGATDPAYFPPADSSTTELGYGYSGLYSASSQFTESQGGGIPPPMPPPSDGAYASQPQRDGAAAAAATAPPVVPSSEWGSYHESAATATAAAAAPDQGAASSPPEASLDFEPADCPDSAASPMDTTPDYHTPPAETAVAMQDTPSSSWSYQEQSQTATGNDQQQASWGQTHQTAASSQSFPSSSHPTSNNMEVAHDPAQASWVYSNGHASIAQEAPASPYPSELVPAVCDSPFPSKGQHAGSVQPGQAGAGASTKGVHQKAAINARGALSGLASQALRGSMNNIHSSLDMSPVDDEFQSIMHPGGTNKLDGPLPWELPNHLKHSDQFISICSNWQKNNPGLEYRPELLFEEEEDADAEAVGGNSSLAANTDPSLVVVMEAQSQTRVSFQDGFYNPSVPAAYTAASGAGGGVPGGAPDGPPDPITPVEKTQQRHSAEVEDAPMMASPLDLGTEYQDGACTSVDMGGVLEVAFDAAAAPGWALPCAEADAAAVRSGEQSNPFSGPAAVIALKAVFAEAETEAEAYKADRLHSESGPPTQLWRMASRAAPSFGGGRIDSQDSFFSRLPPDMTIAPGTLPPMGQTPEEESPLASQPGHSQVASAFGSVEGADAIHPGRVSSQNSQHASAGTGSSEGVAAAGPPTQAYDPNPHGGEGGAYSAARAYDPAAYASWAPQAQVPDGAYNPQTYGAEGGAYTASEAYNPQAYTGEAGTHPTAQANDPQTKGATYPGGQAYDPAAYAGGAYQALVPDSVYNPAAYNTGAYPTQIPEGAYNPQTQVPEGAYNPQAYVASVVNPSQVPEGAYNPQAYVAGVADPSQVPAGAYDPQAYAASVGDSPQVPAGAYDPQAYAASVGDSSQVPAGAYDPQAYAASVGDSSQVPAGAYDPQAYAASVADPSQAESHQQQASPSQGYDHQVYAVKGQASPAEGHAYAVEAYSGIAYAGSQEVAASGAEAEYGSAAATAAGYDSAASAGYGGMATTAAGYEGAATAGFEGAATTGYDSRLPTPGVPEEGAAGEATAWQPGAVAPANSASDGQVQGKGSATESTGLSPQWGLVTTEAPRAAESDACRSSTEPMSAAIHYLQSLLLSAQAGCEVDATTRAKAASLALIMQDPALALMSPPHAIHPSGQAHASQLARAADETVASASLSLSLSEANGATSCSNLVSDQLEAMRAQMQAEFDAQLAAQSQEFEARLSRQLVAQREEFEACSKADLVEKSSELEELQEEMDELLLCLGQETGKVAALVEVMRNAGLDPDAVTDPIEEEYAAMDAGGQEEEEEDGEVEDEESNHMGKALTHTDSGSNYMGIGSNHKGIQIHLVGKGSNHMGIGSTAYHNMPWHCATCTASRTHG
eukprot:gene1208-32550_t